MFDFDAFFRAFQKDEGPAESPRRLSDSVRWLRALVSGDRARVSMATPNLGCGARSQGGQASRTPAAGERMHAGLRREHTAPAPTERVRMQGLWRGHDLQLELVARNVRGVSRCRPGHGNS